MTRLSGKGTTLFFVPRVADVNLWVKRLRFLMPHKIISGSWSGDPHRMRNIEALKAGTVEIFVTTTILERGITLDGIQVAVIWADHPLFDERTLVQIAGRVGRKRENPSGEAVFFARRCSKAMLKSQQWIENQNKLALEQGLIEG
jgi:competence protein ComFA